MSKRPRRNHTPAFKARVALAAIRVIEHWLSLRSSSTWKAQLEEGQPMCSVLAAAEPGSRPST